MALEIEFMEIAVLAQPVSNYAVATILPQGILYVASRTSTAEVPDPVQIKPPLPFNARIEVLPVETGYRKPYLTFGVVSQIPATSLLTVQRRSEFSFRITLNGVLVARGSSLAQAREGLASG